MPSFGPILNIGNLSGGLAYSTASHSAVQAGDGHNAHIKHPQGADVAALISLLQELAQEIGNLTSAGKCEGLIASKKDPDPGRIKRALAAIKSGAEGIEQGGKIIALCKKAYNVIAPLLGLPPSPLI